ncbi:MAG TPA: uroporphyrinogen decarboxylase [Thermoanaerobaculia bacterium]|nr:uroporphyrinogen decarboxylase [Thermoanaerobaculia bacterium]
MSNDLFLRACRGDAVERPPVWLMRQAGRYLPQFRAIRAKVDFLSLCKTPELAAEVTLQPIDELGVDAAILFADILLPLEAMGKQLVFAAGEGPTFPEPVRRREDLATLTRPDVDATLGYVFEAMRQVRRGLGGRVPAIGFGGTPWTLAAYLVEGGGSKHFEHLLAWSYADPDGLAQLLAKIAEVSREYLLGQIEAGAQAIMLFDTWGGVLDAERWRTLAFPPLLEIAEALGGKVPVLYYLHGGAHLWEEVAKLPVQGLGVDWRLPISEVRRRVGPRFTLQGNLDPAALLGPIPEIERRTRAMLQDAAGGPHIANLGHGILPMTPVAHAKAFVRAVQGR